MVSQLASGNYSGESAAKSIDENIVKPIAVSILSPILFIVLSLVLMLILRQVAKWLNKLFKIPLVGTVNKILGAAFGLLKGLVFVYVLCVLLSFMAERTGSSSFSGAVADSQIVAFSQSFSPIEILK